MDKEFAIDNSTTKDIILAVLAKNMQVQTEVTSYGYPISEKLRNRLIGRIEKDEHLPKEQAEKIIDASLGFLDLCAKYPEKSFSPTPLVDIGWHTFLLYTKDYQQFCHKNAGRFIHHEPNDNPERKLEGGGSCATVAFMRRNAIPFNPDLWAHAEKECTTDCDGGNGPGPTSNCTCS